MGKAEEKQVWRARCRVRRAELKTIFLPELQASVERFLATLERGVLGIYWPFGSEPDLRDVALAWVATDEARSLALPVVVGEVMRYRLWTKSSPMTRDSCGLTVPATPYVEPDVVLAPALGFSARGYRLGYGGGYFDRYPRRAGRRFVLVTWEALLVPETLFEAHDVAFDEILTEEGWRHVA